MKDETCIFCKIVSGQIPCKVELNEEEVFVFQDINPKAPVHLLIVPKVHIPDINSLKPEQLSIVGKMMDAAKRLAKEKNIAEGYRLVINNGSDAGQSVFHIHLHLLGGRMMGWPPG